MASSASCSSTIARSFFRVFFGIFRFSSLDLNPKAASKKRISCGLIEGWRSGRNLTTNRARASCEASSNLAIPESMEEPTLQSLTRSA